MSRPDFDNVVFEDRNKAYGAFYLRKFYNNSILIGFLISAFIFSAALSAPLALTYFKDKEEGEKVEDVIVVDMVNVETPPEPEVEEIILPEKPPQVDVATIKNLELEIKKDEEVNNENPPPKVDEFNGKQSGEQTKNGTQTTAAVPPPTPVKIETQEPPKIETWAPEMPEFPGGPTGFLNFIGQNTKYTPAAEDNGIEGTIRVSFVVNTDGTVTDVKIVKGLGYGLDEQVLKAFKKMPKWKPARKGGKDVPLRMTSPVVFTLSE